VLRSVARNANSLGRSRLRVEPRQLGASANGTISSDEILEICLAPHSAVLVIGAPARLDVWIDYGEAGTLRFSTHAAFRIVSRGGSAVRLEAELTRQASMEVGWFGIL
jgi:hypothetical protein